MFGVVVVATGARVHRGDEHKVRWILDCPRDTRDIDDLVFDRLSEDFERLSGEFGELVKEEDTLVCQTHFSGCQCPASTDDRDPASGVMDLAKWSADDEWLFFGQLSDQGIDLTDFQDLIETEWRYDALQCSG